MNAHTWIAVCIAALCIVVSLIMLYHRGNKATTSNISPPPVTSPFPSASSTPHPLFDIVELTEKILLNLETKDLLRAQRVCYHWKSIIESSPSCRKALFLEPGGASDVSQQSSHRFWGQDATSGKAIENVVFNPLLVEEYSAGMMPPDTMIYLFHPKLLNACFVVVEEAQDSSSILQRLFSILQRRSTPTPQASCRRMYITQPPLDFNTISVFLNRTESSIAYARSKRGPRSEIHVWEENGIGEGTTLGELADSLAANLNLRRVSGERWQFARKEVVSEEETETH